MTAPPPQFGLSPTPEEASLAVLGLMTGASEFVNSDDDMAFELTPLSLGKKIIIANDTIEFSDGDEEEEEEDDTPGTTATNGPWWVDDAGNEVFRSGTLVQPPTGGGGIGGTGGGGQPPTGDGPYIPGEEDPGLSECDLDMLDLEQEGLFDRHAEALDDILNTENPSDIAVTGIVLQRVDGTTEVVSLSLSDLLQSVRGYTFLTGSLIGANGSHNPIDDIITLDDSLGFIPAIVKTLIHEMIHAWAHGNYVEIGDGVDANGFDIELPWVDEIAQHMADQLFDRQNSDWLRFYENDDGCYNGDGSME